MKFPFFKSWKKPWSIVNQLTAWLAIVTLLDTRTDGLEVIKQRVEIEWPSRQIEHIFIELLDLNRNILLKSPDVLIEIDDGLHQKIQSMRPFCRYFLSASS